MKSICQISIKIISIHVLCKTAASATNSKLTFRIKIPGQNPVFLSLLSQTIDFPFLPIPKS